MTSKEKVLKKYPNAWLEEQTDKQRQRWYLWRDRLHRSLPEDLIGCGMSTWEAWADTAQRKL